MNFLEGDAAGPNLGLAYGPGFLEFVDANPGVVDYVEVPFEQLRHYASSVAIHPARASRSSCTARVMSDRGLHSRRRRRRSRRIARAERRGPGRPGSASILPSSPPTASAKKPTADRTPTNLTYTLCPAVERGDRWSVSPRTWRRFAAQFASSAHPRELAAVFRRPWQHHEHGRLRRRRCWRAATSGLLLDLSHFAITVAEHGGRRRCEEIDRLPLERVGRDPHLRVRTAQSGVVWDDHAAPAPAAGVRRSLDARHGALTSSRPDDGVQLAGVPPVDPASSHRHDAGVAGPDVNARRVHAVLAAGVQSPRPDRAVACYDPRELQLHGIDQGTLDLDSPFGSSPGSRPRCGTTGMRAALPADVPAAPSWPGLEIEVFAAYAAVRAVRTASAVRRCRSSDKGGRIYVAFLEDWLDPRPAGRQPVPALGPASATRRRSRRSPQITPLPPRDGGSGRLQRALVAGTAGAASVPVLGGADQSCTRCGATPGAGRDRRCIRAGSAAGPISALGDSAAGATGGPDGA